MKTLRDIIKKYCYTHNSLRHDLEGELVFKALTTHGPFDAVFDAGAGGGGYTMEILDRGISKTVFSVEAEDRNYGILVKQLKRYGSKVKTYHGFLEEAPIEEGSMDAVICNQVLEHIEDHDHAAQSLIDTLKPGGILVASVPRSPIALPQAEHVRDGYTEEEFAKLFEAKGMEILGFDWFYTEETQVVRDQVRKLNRKKVYPPKFLFKVDELKFTAEERSKQKPMGLIIICRKR